MTTRLFSNLIGKYVPMFFFSFFRQDRKVDLYEWDGKTLKETAVLEGNQSVVSALAFSPDGKLLASGEVSTLFIFYYTTLDIDRFVYT